MPRIKRERRRILAMLEGRAKAACAQIKDLWLLVLARSRLRWITFCRNCSSFGVSTAPSTALALCDERHHHISHKHLSTCRWIDRAHTRRNPAK